MENTRYIKHEEQIKTLFKKVYNVENKIDDMTDMKLTMNTISLTMQNIQEHNERQDAWNKNMFESQSKLNERQNNTLDRINENLNKLNAGQTNLEGQVTELKQRVDENEVKHSVDLRDIEKMKNIDVLKKYGIPFGVGITIGTFLLEVIKVFK